MKISRLNWGNESVNGETSLSTVMISSPESNRTSTIDGSNGKGNGSRWMPLLSEQVAPLGMSSRIADRGPFWQGVWISLSMATTLADQTTGDLDGIWKAETRR